MNQQKKIFLVITKGIWGGAQRYVYDLATHLNKTLFDVTVVLGSEGAALKYKLDTANIHTIVIGNLGRDIKIFNEIRVFWSLIKLFKSERPDIIHLNSSKIAGLGSLAGRIAKVPKIISTFHGFAFNENRNSLSKILIGFLYWLTLLFSHQAIAVSKYVAETINRWPWVNSKVKIIQLGLDKIEFLSRDDARKALFGDKINPKTMLVGTIAELHHIKGHSHLLEDLAEMADIELVYVAIGEGEERKKLERLIQKYDLSKRAFLFGHIDQAAIYLKGLDIFVLPSLSEGLSYSVLEAGQAGLPVIATSVGGIPEIVENLKTGLLIAPRRPNEIKNAMIYLINHPDEMKNFGERLHEKVVRDFTLDRMVRETQDLYRS